MLEQSFLSRTLESLRPREGAGQFGIPASSLVAVHTENGEYLQDATYVQENDNAAQQWHEGAEDAEAVYNEEHEWTEGRAEHGEGIRERTVMDDAALPRGAAVFRENREGLAGSKECPAGSGSTFEDSPAVPSRLQLP